MTKARDTANIVGGGFSGTIAGATMEPTGDTAAGDNAAMGFTAAEGLILTGQGSTNDVTIKNDADADVIEIPTGTVNVTMAGTLGVTGVVTSAGLTIGSAAITEAELEILDGASVTTAELNLIDGGTARGTTAIADGDGVLINDAGTMRQTNVTTLATYMGTKIGGGMDFLASSGAISNAANVSFTQFDAAKYDHYAFYFQHVIPATDHVVLFGYHSTDGGSSYDSTDGEYHRLGNNDTTGFHISFFSQNVGSASGEYGVSGISYLYAPHVAAFTMMNPLNIITQGSNGGIYGQITDATTARLAAEDTDAIQFAFSSGNIESGEITMFGIVNS